MPRIPFIEARLDLPNQSVEEVQTRLRNHLRKLRLTAAQKDLPTQRSAFDPLDEDFELPPHALRSVELGARDFDRTRRRAERLVRARKNLDRLGHLKRDERERLAVLRDGVDLITLPSVHRADELAAELHADMPWMAPATEAVWHALRRAAARGDGVIRIPPLLLDGPPGIGKSEWARRLARLLDLPSSIVEATNENAGFSVGGLQRGWGTAAPGKPLATILRTRIGNPVVVVDEIDKAGPVQSTSGTPHGLTEALLPLLETTSSRRWECPYFQVPFDMSWISWILTTNRCALLPEPFLSRCQMVRLAELTNDDLVGFARREGARRRLSGSSLETIVETLQRSSNSKHRPSLRSVIRMFERAETMESRPPLH